MGSPLLVLAIIVVLLVVLVATSIRVVAANERLVVFRMGRVDPSGVHGPGRTFLVPIIDRAISVSLEPQHAELDAVPLLTADGRGVSADLDLRYRVVDPLSFAVRVPEPVQAGLRVLTRTAIAPAVGQLALGDALDRAILEAAVVPAIDECLTLAGAPGASARVTRVRTTVVDEAAEQGALIGLGAKWLLPDPDTAGSRTFPGDVAWAARRVGRMARWQAVLVAALAVGVQLIGFAGLPPWSPLSLIFGLFIGVIAVPLVELRSDTGGVYRKSGARRTAIWIAMVALWGAITFGALLLIAIAAGLDRVRL